MRRCISLEYLVPELPEVEVLVRHLRPLLLRKRIRGVQVFRPKVLRPTSAAVLKRKLVGARFAGIERRGKYLVFEVRRADFGPQQPAISAISADWASDVGTDRASRPGRSSSFRLIGHLGMTGRMYLVSKDATLPKHTSVALDLGREKFVFEDTRYFGRFTLDTSVLDGLGVEPLGPAFTPEHLGGVLARSTQPIKIKLLDQRLVAGVGNIYASEALFRAGIGPARPARSLRSKEIERLWQAIRDVLSEAIDCGSTVPLNFSETRKRDALFYFGRAPGVPDYYEERLLVYDREGRPCPSCKRPIRRIVQAGRSTFYCPSCQRRRSLRGASNDV